MIEHPFVFAAVAIAAIATPGPTMLLAFQNGVRGGMTQALPGVAGALVSDLPLIAAVAAGLGSLLAGLQLVWCGVVWCGVVWCCVLHGTNKSDGFLAMKRRKPQQQLRYCADLQRSHGQKDAVLCSR